MLDSRWELAEGFQARYVQLPRLQAGVPAAGVLDQRHQRAADVHPAQRTVAAQPQSLDDVETKFQLSFKTKVVENLFGDNGDLWAAYTQSSRWQVYNAEESRPFRETNYEPEVMLVFRNSYSLGGWHGRMLGFGVNHQSNGRADPISRSWNRGVMNVGLDREDWAVMIRPWWRIPDDDDDDENPGIEDYVGRGDITLVHRWNDHDSR